MIKGMFGLLITAVGWALWWPLVKLSEFGGALIDIGTDWTLEARSAADEKKP